MRNVGHTVQRNVDKKQVAYIYITSKRYFFT